jgi:hypothetical protein
MMQGGVFIQLHPMNVLYIPDNVYIMLRNVLEPSAMEMVERFQINSVIYVDIHDSPVILQATPQANENEELQFFCE